MEPTRPDNIPGYEHPVKSNYSKQSVYKTFTEGGKAKKFSKTTHAGKHYAVSANAYMNDEDDDANCPVCMAPAETVCPCGLSDKKCAEGHSWYTDRDGAIKHGDPHQSQ
jgi:hypothetical protein